jgi:hypothetical protein
MSWKRLRRRPRLPLMQIMRRIKILNFSI